MEERLLLAAVCGVAVASVYAGQPVLAPMGRDLGVPTDSLGWFVATGQLGYLAGLVLLVPFTASRPRCSPTTCASSGCQTHTCRRRPV